MAPQDNIDNEERMLIDPTVDDPAEHLRYELDGTIHPLNGSRMGCISIEIFNLAEPDLAADRAERIGEFIALLETWVLLREKGHADEANYLEQAVDDYMDDGKPFAGACRYARSNMMVFGLPQM